MECPLTVTYKLLNIRCYPWFVCWVNLAMFQWKEPIDCVSDLLCKRLCKLGDGRIFSRHIQPDISTGTPSKSIKHRSRVTMHVLFPRICDGADERLEPLNQARYLRTPVWKRVLHTYLDEGAGQADGKPTGQS